MDIENFEYRKTYYAPEHKWCFLYDSKNVKKFEEKKVKKEMERFKRSRVQSNPETTGQWGTML
jgi:UDP-N-acetylenolpyruvoylglucosamine reductase